MSAWERGDRVEIDCESHCYHGEQGEVLGPDDVDEGTWDVLLDSGDQVTAYSHELNDIISTTKSGS